MLFNCSGTVGEEGHLGSAVKVIDKLTRLSTGTCSIRADVTWVLLFIVTSIDCQEIFYIYLAKLKLRFSLPIHSVNMGILELPHPLSVHQSGRRTLNHMTD